MGIGSGWGASTMGTADGPQTFLNGFHPKTKVSFQDYFNPYQLTLIDAHDGYRPFSLYDGLDEQGVQGRQQRSRELNKLTYNLVLSACKKNQFPLIIGGDHSIATATWPAIRHHHGQEFGLIWIDAHLDAHTFSSSPSKASHGMPISRLLGYDEPSADQEPTILPENLTYIGPRSYEKEELSFLNEKNVTIHSTKDCKEQSFAHFFNQTKQALVLKGLKYGISLDIDVLDPEDAPGTGAQAPNGLYGKELIAALRGGLHDPNLLAFELVEYNPHLDRAQKTEKMMWALLDSCFTVPSSQDASSC